MKRRFNIPRDDRETELLPLRSIESLMDSGLSYEEAKIVRDQIPRRDTPAWHMRENLRARLGCSCISLPEYNERNRRRAWA